MSSHMCAVVDYVLRPCSYAQILLAVTVTSTLALMMPRVIVSTVSMVLGMLIVSTVIVIVIMVLCMLCELS